MKQLFILLSFITFSLCSTVTAQQQKVNKTPATSATVDSFVLKFMNARHVPGLALAVIRDGKLLKVGTYGKANLETNTPVSDTTIFSIASLTKQFIAAAVLLLGQEGKLSVHDPVTKYIDSTPAAWKNITVYQLLSHTSGLLRDPLDYHPYREQPLMEVIRAMYELPLQFQPGEGWLYSNAGYFMLAEIISRVTNQPWDQFITERILQPAGLYDTRTGKAAVIVPNRAAGYHYADQLINAENWISVRPSGAFLSSVRDMIKWDSYLNKGNLLDAAHKNILWTGASLNNGTTVHYGSGWAVDSFLDHERIHHDGQYPGFRADYERFDKGHLNVIALANLDNGGLESLTLKLAGMYDQKLAAPAFSVQAKATTKPITAGTEIPIEINLTATGNNAPGTIVEMEIWDEHGKAANKQDRQNLRFTRDQNQTIQFNWKPEKPGTYSVNVGVYAPQWVMSYSWNTKLVVLNVQ